MTRRTAIIVDDEAQLIALLQRQLATAWPELDVVGTALDADEALELVDAHRPDVAFLDIRMPGRSGLDLAREISGHCHVVFVTAHDEFAVDAFEAAAADYLLKPVDEQRLATTVRRLEARMARPPADLTALVDALGERLRPASRYLEWLQVQHRQDVVLVAVDDVAVFLASEKYTLAITRDHEWVIRTPLKELERELDPGRFWRVHRAAIVRVGAIARVSRDLRGQAVVQLRDVPRTVAVSRAYAHRFRQM